MDLKSWPIFKSGLFRQAKYLVSAPLKSQDALEILETGVVGIEPLPMQKTGMMTAVDPEVKKSWAAIHALKVEIYKNGQPTGRSTAVPISERSYKPLDVFHLLPEEEMSKMASLKDIARTAHSQERANARALSPEKTLAMMVIQYGLVIIGIAVAMSWFKGC